MLPIEQTKSATQYCTDICSIINTSCMLSTHMGNLTFIHTIEGWRSHRVEVRKTQLVVVIPHPILWCWSWGRCLPRSWSIHQYESFCYTLIKGTVSPEHWVTIKPGGGLIVTGDTQWNSHLYSSCQATGESDDHGALCAVIVPHSVWRNPIGWTRPSLASVRKPGSRMV